MKGGRKGACLFLSVKQSGQRDLHDIEPEVEKLRGRESAKRMQLQVAVAQMKISIAMDSWIGELHQSLRHSGRLVKLTVKLRSVDLALGESTLTNCLIKDSNSLPNKVTCKRVSVCVIRKVHTIGRNMGGIWPEEASAANYLLACGPPELFLCLLAHNFETFFLGQTFGQRRSAVNSTSPSAAQLAVVHFLK